MLTTEEIQLIFKLLTEKYGSGWSDDPVVGKLQAKLSIMLEVQARRKGA